MNSVRMACACIVMHGTLTMLLMIPMNRMNRQMTKKMNRMSRSIEYESETE